MGDMAYGDAEGRLRTPAGTFRLEITKVRTRDKENHYLANVNGKRYWQFVYRPVKIIESRSDMTPTEILASTGSFNRYVTRDAFFGVCDLAIECGIPVQTVPDPENPRKQIGAIDSDSFIGKQFDAKIYPQKNDPKYMEVDPILTSKSGGEMNQGEVMDDEAVPF